MKTKKSNSMKNNNLTTRENELIESGYTVQLLRDLKQGEIFQTKPNGPLYVRAHYVRKSARYCYYRYSDANRYYYAKGDTLVIVD